MQTDPFALFRDWYAEARESEVNDSNAMALATDAESDAYFALRSRDSQLGAWASDQSRPLDARATFEARYEALRQRFDGRPVPRPPHWGGYRVAPERIEFWQDREHRLHERRLFVGEGDGWREGLLYP